MKFTSKEQAVAALLVAPVALSEVKSFAMLNILRNLTKSGDATFAGGYYSTTWTVAK